MQRSTGLTIPVDGSCVLQAIVLFSPVCPTDPCGVRAAQIDCFCLFDAVGGIGSVGILPRAG
jgi:hypothetical protein